MNNLVQLFYYILLLFTPFANCYYNCSTPKVTRSYLHNLVNDAFIVVSGTIRSIKYRNSDDLNLEIESIEVTPSRYYKKPDHPPKSIIIQNLMKIEPCPYKLLTEDIRIFILTEDFELLAPLIRISLPVLDQLHTISRGKAHRQRRKSKRTVCENSLCPFGSKCDIHSGKCECRSKCRFSSDVVCGSDDVTYSSMCHLSVRSCMLAQKSGKRLKIKSKGPCEKRNPCEDLRCAAGEECVVKQSSGILEAKCVCPQQCPNYGDSIESSPVCSSHGVDYQSSCHLNHHACESKSNITVKYYGRCDPCHEHACPRGLMCKLGKDRKPECRCSEQCSLEFSPVCGTDGRTYTNECILNLSSCKENRYIAIWKKGKCETWNTPCTNIQCVHGANCYIKSEEEAECQCPKKCDDVMRPICATNGETFDNECEMRRRACETSTALSIKHHGTCGVGVCATYTQCKKPKVCEIEHGKPKCTCPKCNDELKEVCGSDGKTYSNECKLRQAACLMGSTEQNIFVKYSGICEGCENQKCDFYSSCVVGSNGRASCQCPDYCSGEHKEVCGTDGVTYSSECHLRKSACHYKKFIVTAFEGKCDACLHVQCKYGQECRSGTCVCSYNCPENPPVTCSPGFCMYVFCVKGLIAPSCTCTFGAQCQNNQCKCPICDRRNPAYPVCGSDGNVYRNQCDLNTISCRDQRLIHVLPMLSQCTQFNDTCQCNRVGSFGHTCDEEGQCKCRPGVAGLKCDHCLPGFWGIHLIAQGALSCRPCGCSAFGSSRGDCEQSTGKCECHNGALGDKCTICPNGLILTATGCVPAATYKTPRDCASLKCHHSAKCVPSPTSFPDCICPTTCNLDTLGLVANMTVCGSDGTTYSNMCDMKMFACKHQMDVVAVSMGICDDEKLEVLGRLGREEQRNGNKRLGSHCEDDGDCEKLNARCVTSPGRKSVCECADGAKSHMGICEQAEPEDEHSDRERLNLHIGDSQRYISRENLRRFSKISIDLRLVDRKREGIILRMVAEDGKDLEIYVKNRRIVVRIGELQTESLQTFAYNISLEIKWRLNEMHMKLNGEYQKHKFDQLLDTEVLSIFIGSDGKWESSQLPATLNYLEIDEIPVSRDELKVHHLPPRIQQSLEIRQNGSLKFPLTNLGVNPRENLRVEVVFKSYSSSGLLFYWTSPEEPNGDFVTLALIDGKPHFVYDLGSGLSYTKSDPIGINEWIHVKIDRIGRNATMSINGKVVCRHVSAGQNQHLDLTKNSVFFVGYVDDETAIARKVKKLNVPFNGQIRMIRVNELPLDLNRQDLTNEQRTKIDIAPSDEKKIEKCLATCEHGACYERIIGTAAEQEMICRRNEIKDTRGMHLNEHVELSYPNNATFSVSSTLESNFSFDFRTLSEYGVLWFEGGFSQSDDVADFLIIFVDESKLYIGVNLGSDNSLKPISTNLTVADNHWHRVEFRRKERKCELWADGKKVLTIVTSPGNNSLDTNGIAYLGGPKKHKQLKSMGLVTKFVGCVRNLRIFGSRVDLLVDSLTNIRQPNYCHN